MTRIFSILLVVVLFFATTTSVLAAPSASISVDSVRHYVFANFSGLQTVTKINYVVMYDSNRLSRGFEGLIRLNGRTTRTTKKQILGTCSSGRCVYHKAPKNIQLNATFTLKSGQVISVTKTLP